MEENQEKKWCVYKHTNKVNGKVYIGQTCRKPEKRWRNGEGYKDCTYFYLAIQKYGWDEFEHEIISDGLTLEEANQLEKDLIAKHKSNNKIYGYNLRSGGSDGKLSEETKIKIGQAHRGRKLSEEHKRKISEGVSGENAPMLGKHHSKEAKDKMRLAKLGTHRTQEEKDNLSKKLSGRKRTKESIEKSSKAKEKPVLCVEANIVFNSLKQASEEMDINMNGISRACLKGTKAGTYHWKYIKKENDNCSLKESLYCLYIHKNLVNNKVFVGITSLEPEHRFGKDGAGYQNYSDFYSDIKTFGWENFEHIILKEKLEYREACKIKSEILQSNRFDLYKIELSTKDKSKHSHSGENSHMFGKKRTEESKQKIRKSNIESHKKDSKPVKCIELNKIFFSIGEACRQLKLYDSSIIACCKGKQKTTGGYHWEYVDTNSEEYKIYLENLINEENHE